MKNHFLIIFVLAYAAAIPSSALEITSSGKDFMKDRQTLLTIKGADGPVAGAEVKSVYRPNSTCMVETIIGRTDGDGGIQWTPTEAGIVTLSASLAIGEKKESVSRNISVLYNNVPIGFIMVFLVAGGILFGGLAWSLKNTFAREND